VVQSKYYEWTFLVARFDDKFQLMNVMNVVNATAFVSVAAALTLAAGQDKRSLILQAVRARPIGIPVR
jgi:hypothetical protein